MASSAAAALADKLDALVERLGKVAQDVRAGTVSLETDTARRMGVAQVGTELINTVTLPEDQIHLFLPQLVHLTAVRVFIEWNGFDAIPQGDGATISYADLAAKIGGDQSLISTTLVPVEPHPNYGFPTNMFILFQPASPGRSWQTTR
jgi:hypothetical protein